MWIAKASVSAGAASLSFPTAIFAYGDCKDTSAHIPVVRSISILMIRQILCFCRSLPNAQLVSQTILPAEGPPIQFKNSNSWTEYEASDALMHLQWT